jgi:hypothetical protein
VVAAKQNSSESANVPNPVGPKKIKELWAWIVTEEDGGEGVPAGILPNGGMYPLLGADEARVRSFEEEARMIAAQMKLCRFSNMEIIQTLN